MPRHARRAFTLIELLVVIAIVALLIAITLPALRSAREAARATRCAAVMRQPAAALTLYQNDYRHFPAHQIRLPDGSRHRWFAALAEYADTRIGVRCPSTPDWEISRNHSFGYNYKYLGSMRDLNIPGNPFRPYESFPVRDIHDPTRTIAFADGDGSGRSLPYAPEGPDQHPDRWGNHGYTLDPTYIPLRSELGAEKYAAGIHRTFLSERHRGVSNAAFVDAHVAAVTPAEAYADNRLWNGHGFDPGADPKVYGHHLDPHVPYKFDPGSGQEWPYH